MAGITISEAGKLPVSALKHAYLASGISPAAQAYITVRLMKSNGLHPASYSAKEARVWMVEQCNARS